MCSLLACLATYALSIDISNSYELSGSAQNLLTYGDSVDISIIDETVTITMRGPSSGWFGFGFGSTRMDGTYSILASGSGRDMVVSDHELDKKSKNQDNSVIANSPLKLLSDTLIDGFREVVVTRPRSHMRLSYDFPSADSKNTDIDIIFGAAENEHEYDIAYHGRNKGCTYIYAFMLSVFALLSERNEFCDVI